MRHWLEAPLVYWSAGGTLLIPLAVVCFGIWFYFLRSRERLLQESVAALALSGALEHGRRPAGKGGSGVEELVQAALDPVGAAAPPQVFEEHSERFTGRLRRDLGILSALTVVAPLLGLLGTVMGMISTFDAVAMSGGDTGRRVAEGVSRALITTQAGLVIAIPGVFGLMYLRRRLSRLQVSLGTLRLHIVEMTNRGQL